MLGNGPVGITPHRTDAYAAAGRCTHIDIGGCPRPQEYDRAQMRGPRQHTLVHDGVTVEDDARFGKELRKLQWGWIALVHRQCVPQLQVLQLRVLQLRLLQLQVIKRAAHDRRTVDKDDRHRGAQGRDLRTLRLGIIDHWRRSASRAPQPLLPHAMPWQAPRTLLGGRPYSGRLYSAALARSGLPEALDLQVLTTGKTSLAKSFRPRSHTGQGVPPKRKATFISKSPSSWRRCSSPRRILSGVPQLAACMKPVTAPWSPAWRAISAFCW